MLVAQQAHSVDGLVGQMRQNLPDTVSHRQRVDDVLERGRTALLTTLGYRREQTNGLSAALSALNPAAVLERGFAVLTYPASGRAVASATAMHPGDMVRAQLKDGSFDAEVR